MRRQICRCADRSPRTPLRLDPQCLQRSACNYPSGPHSRNAAGARNAFTLIEVLVVVAIIGLLVAILLPSLSKARSLSRRASCLSNMKNVGASITMYMSAHRGWLPVGPADRLRYIDKLTRKIFPEDGPGRHPYPAFTCAWGGKRAKFPHDFVDPPRPETLKRPLTDFLYKGAGLDSPMPLFQCPDDRGVDRDFQYWIPDDIKTESMYEVCGNSYWNNPWQVNEQVSPKRLRITSSLVLAEEGPMYFSVSWGRQVMGWHGRLSRHNMLFLDFHAAELHIDPRTKDPVTHQPLPAHRRYMGPGWFAVNYFEIMDYYR